jgi:hypothetical protein
VIVTEVLAATGAVVTLNVAMVEFGAIVTLAGTLAAAVLLLPSVTSAPPAGAGPFSVTVPVDELPPGTNVGLNVTELRFAAVTVNVAVFVIVLYVAEIATDVLAATGAVVTLNVAVVAFGAIVTLAGTLAAALLLLPSVTSAPPAGAGPFSVTVPVDELPPRTDVGRSLTELRFAAVTVKVAVFVIVPYVAEIATDVLAATGAVVTLNVALVAFGAIVTLAGTLAAAVLLLPSVTSAPPAGAGPFSLTVPVDALPPRTDIGLTVTELRAAAVTVKVAVFVIVPYVAEIATDVLAATGALAAKNVAVVAPETTVTLAGTVATDVLLLLIVTRAPPPGAGPFSVTVPVDELPPRTDVGLNVTELSVAAGAVTVNEPMLVLFA